jgi:hypothetical protein
MLKSLAMIALAHLPMVVFPILLAACTPVIAQGTTQPPRDKDNFHLILLIGQSNMAGRGKIAEQDRQPHPRVLMLDKQNQWVPAVAPIHFDKPGIVGVGLGRTFALDYVHRHPTVTVGLIPCAAGGSPIAAWQPGGYHEQTKSHPYDEALQRTRVAMQDGVLRAILWHQGESDAKPKLADVYEQKFHALVQRLRSELEAPDVPFVAGQMGQFLERPWSEAKKQVDAAHQRLPKHITNTAFVYSDGLNHKGDHVHFDADSYRELGHRYFQAYQDLVAPADTSVLGYTLERLVVQSGMRGNRCWVHARAGAIPPHTDANPAPSPLVVMTTQQLLLSGSDVFYALHGRRTSDWGDSWSDMKEHESFRRQLVADQEVTVCDFTPQWHTPSGKLLGIGQTVWYESNRVMHVRPRATAYAVYDPQLDQWGTWRRLQLPDKLRFKNAGSGSVQRLDLENGEILLPIYFKEPRQQQYSTTVCRCKFDGQTLSYLEHGDELTVNVRRGLYEPSLTRHNGRFYLTMRNDERGYVSTSNDGLHYKPIKAWTFDDGEDLGNYNTQQHWVAHREALYLVYTRRGADNDHVFRHRAPLFMARIDTQKLCVLRDTERVLIPERGARLGNFGVTYVSPHESWVTVTEWMQPAGVEQYGSDNSIFVARLRWNRPNAQP